MSRHFCADHFLLPLPAGFFYSNADQRERLVAAERQLVDDRVQKVLDLKHKVTAAETILESAPKCLWCTTCARASLTLPACGHVLMPLLRLLGMWCRR